MEKITLYVKESYNELVNKVTWPSFQELQDSTVLVLVASLIIAMIIFAMDNVANVILKTLIYGW